MAPSSSSGTRLSGPARRVLVGTCLNALGNGFVLPFLVIYLHEVRHISLGVVGAIIAAQGAVGLVAVPIYGALIDRFGSRPVQLATLVLSTVGALGLAAATSAPQAAVAVAVAGLGGAGLWPAAQSLVAELVPSERRGRYFGINFALLNLGIGVGGLIGAGVVRSGHPGTYQVLFVADAATFVAFIVVLMTLRGVGRPVPVPVPSDDAPAATYRAMLSDTRFRRIVAVQVTLVLVGYAQLDAGFPAYARQHGVSPRAVGLAFAANTFAIVAGQLWLQKRIASVRRTRALVGVAGAWAASWVILATTGWVSDGTAAATIAIVFAAAFAVGEMLLSPTMPALVNDLADDHVRGRYNAAVSWCWSLGNVLGPLAAGAILGAGAGPWWLATVIAGCGVSAWMALRLERVLPARANGVPLPLAPQEPDRLAPV